MAARTPDRSAEGGIGSGSGTNSTTERKSFSTRWAVSQSNVEIWQPAFCAPRIAQASAGLTENLRFARVRRTRFRPRPPSPSSKAKSNRCVKIRLIVRKSFHRSLGRRSRFSTGATVRMRAISGQPARIPSQPRRTTTQISASGCARFSATMVGVRTSESPICFGLIRRMRMASEEGQPPACPDQITPTPASDLLAEDHRTDVARLEHIEDDDRHLVVHAEGKCGRVHHLQALHQRIGVGDLGELLRARVLLGSES